MMAVANALKKIIHIKSNDTTIFILLVYWVYKTLITSLFLLENWNRTILNINETCKQLSATRLQILNMHVMESGTLTMTLQKLIVISVVMKMIMMIDGMEYCHIVMKKWLNQIMENGLLEKVVVMERVV